MNICHKNKAWHRASNDLVAAGRGSPQVWAAEGKSCFFHFAPFRNCVACFLAHLMIFGAWRPSLDCCCGGWSKTWNNDEKCVFGALLRCAVCVAVAFFQEIVAGSALNWADLWIIHLCAKLRDWIIVLIKGHHLMLSNIPEQKKILMCINSILICAWSSNTYFGWKTEK